MSSAPAMAVLSEAVEAALRGRPVRAAVFFTYQLDPGFFELHVLPLLFPGVAAERPRVRLAQLEEALRQVEHIAVFYDRGGLVDSTGTSRLVYDRIPVSLPTGVLHAKNALVLVGSGDDDDPSESLVLLTTSANLTESGWWRNVEVAHVHELRPGSRDAIRDDLLSSGGSWGLLERVGRLDRTGHGADALTRIRRYLRDEVLPETKTARKKMLVPRLYASGSSFPEFLSEEMGLPAETYHLEVISPFFDQRKDAGTLRALLEAVEPRRTRVFLPRDESGAALCSEDHFDAVAGLKGVEWGTLPPAVTKWSAKQDDSPDRFVHAKVYRLFSPERRWEIQVVGSVNLTGAAHQARGGNLESAVVIDTSSHRRPDWWLGRLGDDRPGGFAPQRSEDEPDETPSHPVTVRYDWKSGRLAYLWEREEEVPRSAELHVLGVRRLVFSPRRLDEWVELSAEESAPFGEVLQATAFIDLVADGGEPQRLLVQEVGAPYKPSVVEELGPEEILEYWSLLSQEQRDAFIERKVLALLALHGGVDELATSSARQADDPPSMFDRFAGIFHAFGCLEERLDSALAEGGARGERLASYLLFGRKHDSLPSLVAKVLEAEEGDRVNRYVTLLCCRQLLGRLKVRHPDFVFGHGAELREISALVRRGEEIKEGLDLGTDEERARFLDWLERAFLAEVSVPERSGGRR